MLRVCYFHVRSMIFFEYFILFYFVLNVTGLNFKLFWVIYDSPFLPCCISSLFLHIGAYYNWFLGFSINLKNVHFSKKWARMGIPRPTKIIFLFYEIKGLLNILCFCIFQLFAIFGKFWSKYYIYLKKKNLRSFPTMYNFWANYF